MQRSARETLPVVLPSVAFVAVELALWAKRNALAGMGVEVDAAALGVSFLVGLAVGPLAPRGDRSLPDAMLTWLANAAVGSIGAAVLAFVCGGMRLRMIELLPSAAVEPAELVVVRTGAIFVIGVAGAYGVLRSVSRLGPRLAFALGCATVMLLGLAVRGMSAPRDLPYEALRTEILPVIELEPLSIDMAKQSVRVADADWAYVAVGAKCSFRRASDDASYASGIDVQPLSHVSSFAVCPAIELRLAGESVLGVMPSREGAVVFQIHGGSLYPATAPGGLTLEEATKQAPTAPKIGELDELHAPVTKLLESHASAGVVVVRDASQLKGCTTRVLVDGSEIAKVSDSSHREASHHVLCEAVTVHRSAALGIVGINEALAVNGKATAWLDDEPMKRVHLRDVDAAVAPPVLWSRLAAVGVMAGAFLLLLAAFELVRLRALRDFTVADHAGGGLILLGERRFDAASAVELAPGPVVVRGELPADAPSNYRVRADVAKNRLEVRSAAAHDDDLARRSERVRAASVAAMTLTFSSSVLLIAAWLLGLGH